VAVVYFDRTQRFRYAFATLADMDDLRLHRADWNTPALFRRKGDIPPAVDSFELLPGRHVVRLEAGIRLLFAHPKEAPDNVMISRKVTKLIDVEAGKAYSLAPGYDGGREISHTDRRLNDRIIQRTITYVDVNVWIDFWETNPNRRPGPVVWPHAPASVASPAPSNDSQRAGAPNAGMSVRLFRRDEQH